MRTATALAVMLLAAAAAMGLLLRSAFVRPPAPSTAEGVFGVVVDADGEAVEGARVAVLRPRREADLEGAARFPHAADRVPEDAATVTDDDGRFAFPSLAPGAFTVVARKADFGVSMARGYLWAPDEVREPIRLVAEAGHRVSGVVRGEPGADLAGVTVVAFPAKRADASDFDGGTVVRSDASGAFAFDDLAPGEWGFTALTPDGFCWFGSHLTVPQDAPLTLTVGGPASLSGRVTRPDGVPVAGHVVTLFGRGWTASTTSGPDGRYRFASLPATGCTRPVRAGIFLECSGGGPGDPFPLKLSAGANSFDLDAPHVVRVRGTVVDAISGLPVAGVTVQADDGRVLRRRVADDGRFEFADLRQGATTISLAAEDVTHVLTGGAGVQGSGPRCRLDTSAANPGDVVECSLVLTPAPVVSGRVVGPDGTPVAGAMVSAATGPWWGARGRLSSVAELADGGAPCVGRTDTVGGFAVVSPVVAGSVIVEVRAPGFAPFVSDPVEIGEGTTPRDLVLRIGRGVTVTGRVTDAATGAPVEGIVLRWTLQGPRGSWDIFEERVEIAVDWDETAGCHRGGWALANLGRTGADGRYRFDGVPTGAIGVEQLTEDWMAPGRVWVAEEREPIDAGEGQRIVQDFALRRAFVIRGTVVDRHGAPVAGATVRATDERGERPFGAWVSTPTESDGAFALFGLPQGRWRVRAARDERHGSVTRADGSAPAIAAADDVQAGTEGLVLAPPAGTIAGSVRFKDGQPAGLVWLRCDRRRAEVRDEEFDIPAARTELDGSFRIVGVPDGVFDVVAGPERGLDRERPVGWVRTGILRGVATGARDVVIELERRDQRLAGRVVASDGTPVAAARIVCVPLLPDGEGDWNETHSAVVTDGAFAFADLDVVPYRAEISADGFVKTRFVTNARDGDVVVRLTAAATLTGRVLLPDGTTAGDVWVSTDNVDAKGALPAGTFTRSDGTFEIEGVAPGTHRVAASRDALDGRKVVARGGADGVRVAEGATVGGIVIRMEAAE